MRRYEAAKKKGDYDEEQLKREHAKNALERYMHYYQRWCAQGDSGLTPVVQDRVDQSPYTSTGEKHLYTTGILLPGTACFRGGRFAQRFPGHERTVPLHPWESLVAAS